MKIAILAIKFYNLLNSQHSLKLYLALEKNKTQYFRKMLQ